VEITGSLRHQPAQVKRGGVASQRSWEQGGGVGGAIRPESLSAAVGAQLL
jgi:hypothetical protein